MGCFLQCITALLLTTVTGDAAATDYCQNYKTLSDPWRNIGFTSLGGPKSDANLIDGWYNFTGIGGDRITHYCSSDSSKYLLSSQNSIKFQLYACDAASSNSCAEQNISTIDCGGGLIIYHLVPNSGFYASFHSSCQNTSCGENAQCGFFYGSCECKPGLSIPAGFLPQGNDYGCTDLVKQPKECQDAFTLNCVEILLSQIQNNTAQVIPPAVIIYTLDKLMNSTKTLEDASADQNKLVQYGNSVLNATETLVSSLVTKTNTSYYRNISLPSIQAAVFVLGTNASLTDIPQLNTSNAYLDINISTQNMGIDAVIFLSYTNMSSFLKPSFLSTTDNTEATMMSTVVTVKLLSTSNQATSDRMSSPKAEPITNEFLVTLEHITSVEPEGTLHCVNWRDIEWVDGNCKVIPINSSHTRCRCVHPGTFALIMQTNGYSKTTPSMDMLNTVAVSVGLFFLGLALLTFAVCRRNPKVINTALINLCISLFLAHLLFLLTQKLLNYIYDDALACAVLAGVLHFLFLSAFVWMFIEAVLLFILVKNLTKIRSNQTEILSWKCLIVIGYVIPLLVTGVSAGLFPDGYGSEQCWLKMDRGFLWSFLAPVCFILGANMLLFIMIGFLMFSTLRQLNNETLEMKITKRDKNLLKSVMLKTLLQFVVIGCSWILGFFTETNDVVKILFLVFNSQQGTFIFFVHCLLNHEIRQQYKKLLCGFCLSSRDASNRSST